MRREYPADLWLTYRTIRYRPAQLSAFVARGGWGPGYRASDCRMVPQAPLGEIRVPDRRLAET